MDLKISNVHDEVEASHFATQLLKTCERFALNFSRSALEVAQRKPLMRGITVCEDGNVLDAIECQSRTSDTTFFQGEPTK